MNTLDFLALSLAAGDVVDVWFNGSIFSAARGYMQNRADSLDATPEPEDELALPEDPTITEETSVWTRLGDRLVPTLLAELLSCSYCFSRHTPLYLALCFYVPSLFLPSPWSDLFKLPVYALAASRLGWVLNGILPARLQYDRYKQL